MTKTSSADIAAAISKAQADLEAAEAAVTAAERSYDEGLLELDKPALRKLLDVATEAKIDIDQVRAKIAKLQQQHADAIEAEADRERRAAYDKAQALAEAARKRLARDYPKHALAIRDMLREVAEADVAVQAVNADLPEGAARLAGPESDRSTPTLYREDIGEEVVDLWCGAGDLSTPIPDDLQRKVQPNERPRRGDNMLYGRVRTENGVLEVALRRFLRRTYLPHQIGRSIESLSSSINLPPLHAGASPFFEPANHAPARLLAELEKPLLPRPQDPERVPEVEHANPTKGSDHE